MNNIHTFGHAIKKVGTAFIVFTLIFSLNTGLGQSFFQTKLVHAAIVVGVENTQALCSDGIDNDGDFLIDASDPDCAQFYIQAVQPVENTQALCSDGIDNDGDFLIDLSDPDCVQFYVAATTTPPTNGQLRIVPTFQNDQGGTSTAANFWFTVYSTSTNGTITTSIPGTSVLLGATFPVNGPYHISITPGTPTPGPYNIYYTNDNCEGTLTSGTLDCNVTFNDELYPVQPPTINQLTIVTPTDGQEVGTTTTITGACQAGYTVNVANGVLIPNPTSGQCSASSTYSFPLVFPVVVAKSTQILSVTQISSDEGATSSAPVTVSIQLVPAASTTTATSTPPTSGGGGTTSGGGSSGVGRSGGSFREGGSTGGGTGGQVLGAFTSADGTPSLSCPAFINEYMKETKVNTKSEVVRLQRFLNENESAGVPITGFFGKLTTTAVNNLQLKYSSQILQPWVNAGLLVSATPTGYVYKTTKWFINSRICTMQNSTTTFPFPVLN